MINTKRDKNTDNKIQGIIQKCLEVTPASVGHYINSVMSSEIKPIYENIKIAGPAVTVSCPTIDSTVVHYIMKYIQAGDIIVIDRFGDLEFAAVGEMVALMAKNKKAAGIVIDGAVTDRTEIKEMSLPVFARRISAKATRLIGISGEMNTTIQCGGVTVNPNDIIFADDNGVVVIPLEDADEILKKAKQSEIREVEWRKKISNGESLSDLSGATELFENYLEKK